MKSMKPKSDIVGAMRRRISIQQYSTARDASGGEVLTWSELAAVWAATEYATSSDEVQQGTRVTAQTNTIFTIRYRADVTEKMRILWKNKHWNIRALLPDNHLDYLEIEAEHYET